MGVLDDAIRDHLALKRKHGAPEAELARAEAEALGPARRESAADTYVADPEAYGERGGAGPYDVLADETAATPFDHQEPADRVSYEPPEPGPPTEIAAAPEPGPPTETAPPPEAGQPTEIAPPPAGEPPTEEPLPYEDTAEAPPPVAYEPPVEHPPAAEPYEPPPVEHPPPAEPYESPERPEAYEPRSGPEAYEPPSGAEPPAAYEPPVEHPPAETYHAPAHDPAGHDPHDYEDFSYKGEPPPPGYDAGHEEPAPPEHGEPIGQGDPLVPYSWHPPEADAPHEDPGAPHEALHEAEVVPEEPEPPYDAGVVQDAEVVPDEPVSGHEDPPAVGYDDTAVKPPDEAYREAAAHQPTEYFTPPDVEPEQESRGRRLRRLFSRKRDG